MNAAGAPGRTAAADLREGGPVTTFGAAHPSSEKGTSMRLRVTPENPDERPLPALGRLPVTRADTQR